MCTCYSPAHRFSRWKNYIESSQNEQRFSMIRSVSISTSVRVISIYVRLAEWPTFGKYFIYLPTVYPSCIHPADFVVFNFHGRMLVFFIVIPWSMLAFYFL